ncbi:MAG: tetratricopeptide repeat protein [Gammaproteobacteria bacterium]
MRLYLAGRRAAASALLREAAALAPEDPEVLNNLGSVLREERQLEEAIVCHHRALRLQAEFPEAWCNLGNALYDYGRLEEAELSFRTALTQRPAFPSALINFGNVLRRRGRAEDAIACYRKALALDPGIAFAYNNLGTALKTLGRWQEAVVAYRRALELEPGSAIAYYNLGNVLKEAGEAAEAERLLLRALELDPALAEAHLNLGNLRKEQGRLDEAMTCYSRAVAARPDYAAAHANLLFTLAYVDGLSQARIFELHRDWGRRHAQGLARRDHANDRSPERRLRIAYVSPDLRSHACAFFVEPLLRHHDRTQVEVHAYAEVAQPDAVTQRLQGLCDVWRSTVGLTDEQVADLIRADGIDVLIDLAGHTANGRLLALARKPAPVQVEYLGYPATTGIEAMDWRLTDAVAEPVGAREAFYTERLHRLPHSLWCYQPFADMGEVSASPAQARGYVSFGSFNNYAKVGPRVVALWAEVLKAVPRARLVMITVPQGEAQAALWARFESLGVARERVVLHDRLGRGEYVSLFGEVDVALDPFPCNGGTTTCDALWMGLPVVALRGETFLSRASLSVLAASGLADFAVEDEAEYVELCRRLASDVEALSVLRAGLRPQLASSPLLDAAGFTRDLEAAYRAMWRAWCSEGKEI